VSDDEDYGPAHQPERPSWNCLACGNPWPCQPAWEYLRDVFPSAALAIYLTTMLGLAAADMPDARPAILYVRFIEQTGHRSPGQQRKPGNGRW
jgi:hypothetical protein